MANIKDNIVVSVHICTYNQEQWIRQTIESILTQETEYPFELVIGEDHGTDGTRAICQEYADKYENVILLPSEKNLGIMANWANCIKNGRGKYIMGCAGDDYWNNPHKIQMQVEYMESHPECVICHTEYNQVNVNTGKETENYNKSLGINPPEGRIQNYVRRGQDYISGLTSCIRRESFEKYVPVEDFIRLGFPREDWPTYIVLTAHGNVKYLPVSTATYRVGQESITNTSDYDRIIKRAHQDKVMTEYLYTLFPEWGAFMDGPYFDNIGYHNALLAAYRNNDYFSARKFAKLDKYPTKATRMTKMWLLFMIYRRYMIRK